MSSRAHLESPYLNGPLFDVIDSKYYCSPNCFSFCDRGDGTAFCNHVLLGMFNKVELVPIGGYAECVVMNPNVVHPARRKEWEYQQGFKPEHRGCHNINPIHEVSRQVSEEVIASEKGTSGPVAPYCEGGPPKKIAESTSSPKGGMDTENLLAAIENQLQMHLDYTDDRPLSHESQVALALLTIAWAVLKNR